MNFTEDQQAAIFYRENKSAAVSASAGSGKTAVLVEHIANLISDEEKKVPADRIAAVTFTEKAAAELKQRLNQKIMELMEKSPGNTFLRDQSVALSSARISTISSFCLSLVRDNIRLLPEVDEGFKICEETKARMLSIKAGEKLFEIIYTEFSEEKKAEIAKRLGDKKAVLLSVGSLFGFLCNIPDPTGWKKEQDRVFGDPDEYFKKYVEQYIKNVLRLTEEIIFNCQEAIVSLPKSGSKTADNLEKFFGFYSDSAKTVKEAIAQGNYIKAFEAAKGKIKKPTVTGSDFSGTDFKERRDEAAELFEQCATGTAVAANYVYDAENIKASLDLLFELEEIYRNEYTKLKRAAGVLDFADLEQNALKAVRSGGSKGLFEYIIVDEFQDSNDIQYEIFRELSKDETNLYFVGDVKQCIYAFRNANPEIFAGLENNDNYNKIKLSKNFRSSDSVLNAVNSLFGNPVSPLPRSFSGGTRWEDMKSGRGIGANDGNITEFAVINVLKARRFEENKEEKYAAKRILEMVKSGFPVHNKDGSERRCGYGDFAILLRNNKDCIRFRKVLESYGIPCVSEGEKHFTDLMEVEIALAILSAVLRPNNDTETVKAMMSPVYGFTAEDMAKIKLSAAENVSLYSAVSTLTDAGGSEIENNKTGNKPDGKLLEKAVKFTEDMKLFRKTASGNVTYDLIRNIYEVTLLPKLMRVGRNGREREANLRLLLYYSKNYVRPADFLNFMKNISRRKFELEQAVVKEKEESSVKIMTIHKSKGLQFPIVFVSDINKKPNVADTYRDFIFDGKMGAGVLVCDYEKGIRAQTAAHYTLEEGYRDKLNGEDMRLFYVALTRAEEKLIITATNKLTEKKKDKKSDEKIIDEDENKFDSSGNYFDFVASNSEKAVESIKILPRIKTYEDVSAAADILPEFSDSGQSNGDIDTIDKEKLLKKLSARYKYEQATKTPAKFTATALGVFHEDESENNVTTAFYMGLPLFMKEGKQITGKELGDIYHCVMEHIDFNAVSAEAELERLLKDGTITEQEKEAVKAAEIQKFLDSRICERVRRSGNVLREFKILTTVNESGIEDPANDDLSFIQGIADMCFEEEDGFVLVDYKTNKNVNAAQLLNEYSAQLEIYKKALEEMLGEKVKECLLYSFWLGDTVAVN